MKIPFPERDKNIPGLNEAYIRNPYPGKELLTVEEALDSINRISGMILIDKRYRHNGSYRNSSSFKKY